MKLKKTIDLALAVEVIANETDTEISELMEVLNGIAWSEEDGPLIEEFSILRKERRIQETP